MPDQLTAKLQFKDFEPGEFISTQLVDASEAIKLIESFPWESERDHLQISLTAPSITFQSDSNFYLKLALYYNHKFVLYFFDNDHLYDKSFYSYKDSYPDIKEFFEQGTINKDQFKKEITWFQDLPLHFISQDFTYSIAGKSIFNVLDKWTKYFSIVWFFYVVYLFYGLRNTAPLVNAFFIFMMSMSVSGMNILLTINYYRFTKNKKLILSKGASHFWYGTEENMKKYNKEDVFKITIKKNTGSRCPWGDYTITFLDLNNGETLKITSLLLPGSDIATKMNQPAEVIHTTFPFCKLNV